MVFQFSFHLDLSYCVIKVEQCFLGLRAISLCFSMNI